jgi:hypothetical protein
MNRRERRRAAAIARGRRVRPVQWLAVRKEAGLKIDPETAEVFWNYGQVLDPYGLYELTEEEKCVGRNYFARQPGSDVSVLFDELPDTVCDRLRARMRAGEFDEDKLDLAVW